MIQAAGRSAGAGGAVHRVASQAGVPGAGEKRGLNKRETMGAAELHCKQGAALERQKAEAFSNIARLVAAAGVSGFRGIRWCGSNASGSIDRHPEVKF